MRLRRLLRAFLILLIVVVLALGGAGVYLVRRPFPQISGTLRVPGLAAPVEVIRDRWGIPHVYAQNSPDLFFTQGYVHAQERLWQMELFRRAAAGRLSEIFGPATLEADRRMRVLGLRRAAEESWRAAGPLSAPTDPDAAETASTIQAYSAGVNAFIESHRHRLPLEFTLLRLQPEPWTPVDTIGFGKLMAWILGGNWSSELLRASLAARFGPEGAAALLPRRAPGTPTITSGSPGGVLPRGFPFAAALAGVAGLGSNNWVVGPARSASGGALFANDIHLDVQVPSIWYEMHLVGGPYDVIGGTFAGAPGVIAGHNRHIAWGLTTANVDEQDLYVERFHPRDPNLYQFQGRWERAQVVREEITVRGRPDAEVVTVRITRHGPVLNPAVRGLSGFVALRWLGLDPDRIIQAVLAVNRATNWEEFRTALRTWWAPAHNFGYADRDGNIGYALAGRIPIRAPGADGLTPAAGWTGTAEWQGFVPVEEHPAAFNPPPGFIVTANNRVVPEDYPYYLGDDFDSGIRAARIAELLAAGLRRSADDMAAIQLDVTSLLARRFVQAWQTVRLFDPDLVPLFDEVKRWDGLVTADSRPAAVYESLLLELLSLVFRDTLDADVARRYVREDDAPVVLLELSGRPDDPWWSEGRDRVIEDALRRALRDLERRLGPDRTQWRWGAIHTPRFEHPLGRVPGLSWIFNVPPPVIGGDPFTVNVAAFDPADPFRTVAAPSYRRVIDMKDLSARAIHAPGQSGLPFHRHYRDFTRMWAQGQYHPLLLDRDAIVAAQEGTLRLLPP